MQRRVQRQREGKGEAREGRESDVVYRQELARLTHDHTHTGRYTYKYVL